MPILWGMDAATEVYDIIVSAMNNEINSNILLYYTIKYK